jgi:DNA primase small subunit
MHDTCPKCKSNKLDLISLPCQNCISGVKKEILNLMKILTDDLQIDSESIRTTFSGNEGFHVYVSNSSYNQLGSNERRDLIDYIKFQSAIPERFGFNKKNDPSRSSFPDLGDPGWSGRVAKELFGSKSKRSKVITKVIADGKVAYQQKLEAMKDSIGVKIDSNVTSDIHRIFRLEGSLNSKSSLVKLVCEDIEKFNPYTEACLIDDQPVEISANSPIKFRLKNTNFGPYTDEKISVPKYAAAYMICKGLASVSNA